MADLETRIHTWVDQRVEGVAPVTLDEIHERATTIPIDADPLPQPPRRYHPRPLAIAAAILLIAATIGATILLTDNTQDNDVITDTGEEGLAVYLDLIPDEADRSVELADLEAARASTGVPRPDPGASLDSSVRYIEELTDADPLAFWFPVPIVAAMPESGGGAEDLLRAVHDDVGFDLAQVTSWASWGGMDILGAPVSSEAPTIVLTGIFDAAAIERAVTETSSAADDAVVREHRGVRYFGWHDDDDINIPRRTPMNQLGQRQRIGLIGDHLVITHSDQAMNAIIDRVLDGPPPAAPVSLRSALAALLDQVPSDEVIWDVYLGHSADAFGPDGPQAIARTASAIPATPEHDRAHVSVFLLADEQDAAVMADRYEMALDAAARDAGMSDARARLESATDLSVDGALVTFSMERDDDPEVAALASYRYMSDILITGIDRAAGEVSSSLSSD